MSVALAVALLALLVALFTLVALVAVYARVRALEATGPAELSGYVALVGRQAPAAVRPGPGQRAAVVAVLDAHCALCHAVWDALCAVQDDPHVRVVALVDRPEDFAVRAGGRAELLADPDARADLFEGYSPTLLAVDAAGVVTHRSFVYSDTDLGALVQDLTQRPDPMPGAERHSEGREVTRA
ncbi:hypothetical protein ACQPWY_09550 [Pseudonocardia xinjiangensis]|uniref:hypothetical protein n=1 Tax=Pseudonocardia xinjiangensis TaxID=75289 RepID=UPI003D928952